MDFRRKLRKIHSSTPTRKDSGGATCSRQNNIVASAMNLTGGLFSLWPIKTVSLVSQVRSPLPLSLVDNHRDEFLYAPRL